jgi:hypothetical protein
VHVDYLDVVEMRLGVSIFVNNNPTCVTVVIDDDEASVVPPYQASAQALVDPFAYLFGLYTDMRHSPTRTHAHQLTNVEWKDGKTTAAHSSR